MRAERAAPPKRRGVLRSGGIAALLLASLLAGCSSAPRTPDLVSLYAKAAAQPKPYPLIVIPGIMGSRLSRVDDGREVWPGPFQKFLLGGDFDALALPLPGEPETRPALHAGGIFHEIAGQDFYGRLIDTLDHAGGYDCVPAAEVSAATDCVLFAWDWRRGMVTAAQDLDALIERLRVLRGDPALKVDLVAHSAGGLVARYFVRFGAEDVLGADSWTVRYAGGDKVRQTVLIGTPNYGSVTALQRAMTGIPLGLARIRPETTATMPGMFQLLPHPDRTWMIDIAGQRMDIDLFDAATWRHNRWSVWDPEVCERIRAAAPDEAEAARRIARLERFFADELVRARRFHRALSSPAPAAPSRYIVFGSACFPTAARCLLEEVEGEAHIRLLPKQIRHPRPGVDYEALMIEPGDGSVTKASLLARDSLDRSSAHGDFPVAWATFICERHEELTGAPTFQDNLLNALLYGAY